MFLGPMPSLAIFHLPFVLYFLHVRPYSLRGPLGSAMRVWTDASTLDDSSTHILRLAALVWTPAVRRGVVFDVPADWLQFFTDRRTQIAIGEILVVMLLFVNFGDLVQDTNAVIFVDKLTALRHLWTWALLPMPSMRGCICTESRLGSSTYPAHRTSPMAVRA